VIIARARSSVLDLERGMKVPQPVGDAARYLAAAARQTDNIIPRTTRIEILEKLLPLA
jgi:hypothetical protein